MDPLKLSDYTGENKAVADAKDDAFDLMKAVSAARIRSTDKINPANYVLKINNVKKLSKGNISAWIGKAKSKKTFALSMIIAAIISGENLFNMFKSLIAGKVILFDTEQSKYDVQKVLKRIEKLAGTEFSDNLIVYGLRSYNPDERVLMIEHILKTTDNVDAIIIDGVRDLIYDILDAKEGAVIINKLMKWSEIYDFHLATVLHSNKGDGNARGHIGTELTNKAETIIRVEREEKDHSISYIEELFGRGKGIPKIAFQVDNQGMPSVIDVALGLDGIDGDDLPF